METKINGELSQFEQLVNDANANIMKPKLLLVPVIMLVGLAVSVPVSADTTDPTRVEIEAQGNQKINALWSQYQQALQEREDAWNQGQGNRFSPAYMTADAKAGATYQEWLRAQTQLGDRLHAYDVSQWEKEEQDDQPSNQTPVDDSQVPGENSQALNTQGSQATVPTSQSATPASQAKLSSQPATQELTQQASVADPASQPITQFTAQKPQQATTSQASDKPANLSSQVKKPAQSNTVQNDQQTKLPQTGNGNLLTVVGTLLFAFLGVLIGVWKEAF